MSWGQLQHCIAGSVCVLASAHTPQPEHGCAVRAAAAAYCWQIGESKHQGAQQKNGILRECRKHQQQRCTVTLRVEQQLEKPADR